MYSINFDKRSVCLLFNVPQKSLYLKHYFYSQIQRGGSVKELVKHMLGLKFAALEGVVSNHFHVVQVLFILLLAVTYRIYTASEKW